jgi:hypothetical protein
MGTRATFPAILAAVAFAINVTPSMTGRKGSAKFSIMLFIVVAGAARTQASVVQRRDAVRFNQDASELVPKLSKISSSCVPLSMIAARNGGFFGKLFTNASTDSAPADSPNMVTLVGLPPKA